MQEGISLDKFICNTSQEICEKNFLYNSPTEFLNDKICGAKFQQWSQGFNKIKHNFHVINKSMLLPALLYNENDVHTVKDNSIKNLKNCLKKKIH